MDKAKLRDYISDLFSDFLYYDRKEDPVFTMEDAKNLHHEITREELISMFISEINKIYK